MTDARGDGRLRVGVVCYGSFGGSGIVATEIGLALARRGHEVHFVSREAPRRYDRRVDGVYFHGVELRDYPLLEPDPYTLGLASKLVDVSRWEKLDVVHVHYAVPHAASAYLARQTLGAGAPRFVTTLHGTDTTIVGAAPGYRPVTAFCIEQSDAVTVPSRWLEMQARARLGISPELPVEVVPNFVDTQLFAPASGPDGRCLASLFGGEESAFTVVHVSNCRPVKRLDDVAEVFARVASAVPARLVVIGDGPDRSQAEATLRRAGLAHRVRFLGMQEHFVDLLSRADVLLMPSESESFGLAALEAQSCGVPVVATDVGGLPEVVVHGETGCLAPVGDVAALAGHVVALARDEGLRRRLGDAARAHVLAHFEREPVIDRYEALYRDVLARPAPPSSPTR